MEVNEKFCVMTQEDELMVDGGGWNEFGKAFLGTVLIAGGVVVCAVPVPGAVSAGCGMIVLEATGIASCKK